jgi:hypothetical protein
MSSYNPIYYSSLGRRARERVELLAEGGKEATSDGSGDVESVGLAGTRRRVLTFTSELCCEHAVDVVVAATQGWIGVKGDDGRYVLRCVQCKEEVTPPGATDSVAAPPSSRHRESCVFRLIPPPTSMSPWFLPIESDLLAQYNESMRVSAGVGYRVVDSIAEKVQVADEVLQWCDDPLSVVALHGWRVQKTDGTDGLHCSWCGVVVTEKREVFDAVGEHRVICPWAMGYHGREPGWRRLLTVLTDRKRSIRDVRGDTPARQVARILGGDDVF